MSDHVTSTLHEYVIMALGAPATPQLMQELRSLYDSTGDFTVVDTVINRYMGSQASSVEDVYTQVANVAQNGLGLSLDRTQAMDLTNWLGANGVDSWAELFSFFAGMENEYGVTLNNRAAAAESFCVALDTAEELSSYSTQAGHDRVVSWLDGVTNDPQSLTNALRNLDGVMNQDNLAGHPEIDLSDYGYGKLIHPIQVDGKWFYYWDRNGDGVAADQISYRDLDALFTEDVNGNNNSPGGSDTTGTYRYATLCGVRVAIPTMGDSLSDSPLYHYLADNNNAYTGLAAIWDSCDSGYMSSGVPDGWNDEVSYLAAERPYFLAPHIVVDLNNGYVDVINLDAGSYRSDYNIALEVLGTVSICPL